MKQLGKLIGIVLLSIVMSGCTSISTPEAQSKSNNQKLADYNVQLGIGYLQQEDMPRAKQKLLVALEKAPNWPPALEAMGYFYQITGERNKAQDYYLQALKIAPHSGTTLNNYGGFLCAQGRYRESLTYFNRALEDENYLKTAEVNENAGLCAAKLPDYKLAEQYLKKALLQNPSRLDPLLDLADISNQQGKYRDAVKYLNLYAEQADLDAQHEKMRATLMRKLKPGK
jgi:type IV pilus assembly protein PilF